MATSIKLKVGDIKRLAKLKEKGSQEELRGGIEFILELVQTAELAAKEARVVKANAGLGGFHATECIELMRRCIPDATMPPFPPPEFFRRINTTIASWRMTPEYIEKLCEKAKELKPPYQISWILANHERIMAGTVWGQASGSTWRAPQRPGKTGDRPWHGGGLEPKVE